MQNMNQTSIILIQAVLGRAFDTPTYLGMVINVLVLFWHYFLHFCQDQHYGQVYCDYGLEEKSLKVDRRMAHDVQEAGREEYGEEDTEKSPSQDYIDSNTSLSTNVSDVPGLVPDYD